MFRGVIAITDIKVREERQKKWENYWYHYKWHTWFGVFVVFCLLITLGDILGKEKYDLMISYVGQTYTTTEDDQILESRLEQYVPDFDGNGEVNIKFNNFTIPAELKSQEDADQQLAMITRTQVEMADGVDFIYIFDDEMYEYFEMEQAAEDLTYTGSDKIKDSVKYDLDDSVLLKDLYLDGEGTFMVMRSMIGLEEGRKYDKSIDNYNHSKEVLENIIKDNKVNS